MVAHPSRGRLGHALLIRFAHKYARPRLGIASRYASAIRVSHAPCAGMVLPRPLTSVRVPGERLELSCLATMGFESIASTNSAPPAYVIVLRNSFPIPDFRYFSRARAATREGCSSV